MLTVRVDLEVLIESYLTIWKLIFILTNCSVVGVETILSSLLWRTKVRSMTEQKQRVVAPRLGLKSQPLPRAELNHPRMYLISVTNATNVPIPKSVKERSS